MGPARIGIVLDEQDGLVLAGVLLFQAA